LKEDLQLNKDSKLLASNFTRSTLIDLHHWMSSHPGSIAELIETMQDLLDIQANVKFTPIDFFKETYIIHLCLFSLRL